MAVGVGGWRSRLPSPAASLAALACAVLAHVAEAGAGLKYLRGPRPEEQEGRFSDGDGMFGWGRSEAEEIGLCILEKVGAIFRVVEWELNLAAFLGDLQADTAACCGVHGEALDAVRSSEVEQQEPDKGYCCFGPNCCGDLSRRATQGSWCDVSHQRCERCGGQPNWCEVPKNVRTWCPAALERGRSILHKLAVGPHGTVASDGEGLITGRPGDDGCHDAVPGEDCYSHIRWTKRIAMLQHPERYLPWNLTTQTADKLLQANLWMRSQGNCTLPCGMTFSSDDLVSAFAGHLLAIARELLGTGNGADEEAKRLMSMCKDFPRQPCNKELGVPKVILS